MRTRIAADDPGTVLGVWAHPDDEAYVAFTGLAVDRKVAAVRADATQTAGRLVDEVGEEDFRRWWSTEAFVASEPGSGSEAGVSRAVAASGGAR